MKDQRLTTLLLTITAVLLVGGGVLIIKKSSKHEEEIGGINMASASSTGALPVSIQTVTDQKGDLGSLENTWPGEIISFGDVQIQPRRAGTIIEWNVNIGQKIKKGQIIAKLSTPPAMPELIAMLAEQAKMVTEARVDSKAQVEFAEKKKQQLIALLGVVEKAKIENGRVFDNTLSVASSASAQAILQAKNASIADQQKIKATLEQAVGKELQLFGITTDAIADYRSGKTLILNPYESLGGLSLSARGIFFTAITNAVREIVKESSALEIVGAEYFQAAIKLVAGTYAGGEISADQLMEMRKMIAMDQMTFLEAVKDYQMSKTELVKMETEYKLMSAEKEIDYAMQQKENEEQVAMLEKEITMNNGRVAAAEASYSMVAGSINGNLAIVSPVDGVISSIMKKNGDFVEPGMAVASMNTGRKEDRFVRFRIPSNIRLPESGAELTIMRPGFSKDIKHVRLIGVGTALDGNGSYLADAKFIDSVDWPVNVSVRVLPDDRATSTLFVSLGALEWGDKGTTLWMISADNTIKKQIVKTGRTLGEKVEVYEGILYGDRYIAKLVPGLKEGIKVREGEVASVAKTVEDAHGSGHD